MKTRKRFLIVLLCVSVPLICYIAGYLHAVHPMPIRMGPSNRESVEPVFQTTHPGIIKLFRPAVAVDRAAFPARWEVRRFQLPRTDLAGFRKMAPFRARVESVGRTTLHSTGVSTLRLGLRLESGHFLEVHAPEATEEMFALAGALTDSRLHEFPARWFDVE